MLLFLASFFVSALAAPTISPYAYSDAFARNKILTMCSASVNIQPLKCLKVHFEQPELKRRYDVACSKYDVDRCVAYTAMDHVDQAILVGFRATSDSFQFDLEAEETAFGNRTYWVGGGRVSEYFANGFMAIWNGGMKNDFITLRNLYPTYQVWIAGHSLGGAMASLCASYIATLNLADATKMRLVTFGQPRTGDQDFATAHDKALPYSYRIIHEKDEIAHLPMQYYEHYHHHKAEVWYNNNMTTSDTENYRICYKEDSLLCSDSQKGLNRADHTYYFNTDVYGWGSKGCPP